jgi:hypothetical protein
MNCEMDTDEEKTFQLSANKLDLAEARMRIAAAATEHNVRLLSIEEHRSRLWINLDVTVTGHPQNVRDFHSAVGGGGSGGGLTSSGWWLWGGDGGLDDFAFGVVVDIADEVLKPVVQRARRKWQSRHDPPLPESHPKLGPGDARTTVTWTWKQMLPDGDAVGPVRVETYVAGQDEPVESEDSPNWMKRSHAVALCAEHNFVFLPRDLPDE